MKNFLKILVFLFITSAFFISCDGIINNNGNQNSGTNTGGGNQSKADSGNSGSSSGTTETSSSSVEFVKKMGLGWNLGNTLDATYYEETKSNQDNKTETSWGMPATTQEMIKSVYAAGFKTIRIPVSWHNHIESVSGSTYKIDSKWMARAKEIVDWAIAEKMYVIINIHHDNMKESSIKNDKTYGYALSKTSSIQEKSTEWLTSIWTQIATEFSSYDESLIFEVLNEPRDIGGEVGGNEWWTNDRSLISVITDYEKTCINAIRSVNGNENRYIMVPGYAASGSDSSLLKLYEMPEDSAKNKLILSAHAYSPYYFAMSNSEHTTFDSSDAKELTNLFDYLKENYIDKGIGVVMGEASASDKNNLSEREKWAKDYFTKATKIGIPVVLWDNMVTVSNGGKIDSGECHGYFNRKSLKWYFPSLIKTMGTCVYGSDFEKTAKIEAEEIVELEEGELISSSLDGISWGISTTINAISNAKKDSTITFTTTECSKEVTDGKNIIQIFNKDWTPFGITGSISGGNVNDEGFVASSSNGSVVWTLSESDAEKIKNNGFIIQVYGIKVNSIKFK